MVKAAAEPQLKLDKTAPEADSSSARKYKPDDDELAIALADKLRGHLAWFHASWRVLDNGTWCSRDAAELRRYIRAELRSWRDAGVQVNQQRIRALAAMLEDDNQQVRIQAARVLPEFDREKAFIDEKLIPLRRDFPALRVVFEHITTKDAADYVRDAEGDIAATITAHHLLYNRNAIFSGGLRPHYYCLPVLKREIHRQTLVEAAISGNPRYFLGTDSAPHAKGDKESDCGCAGCYTALHALELYATVFEAAGALDRFEGFASHFGADFYRLPRHRTRVGLRKDANTIPAALPYGTQIVVPLAAGETLGWRFLGPA